MENSPHYRSDTNPQNQVQTIYKKVAGYYTNKQVDKLFELYYDCKKEIAQSRYLNQESDSQELVSSIENDLNKDQVFTLENYELKFYANGKIVALVRTDIPYKGKSALFSYKDKKYSYYSLLLHRPSANSALQVIR